MNARLADESGFTLVELLSTMVIGGIVLFALLGLVDLATRQQAAATDRIDSNDRGRRAMDVVTAQLRSRVCVSGTQGSIVTATPSVLEFFSSFGITPETTVPPQTQRLVLQRRRLSFTPTNELVEEMWLGTAAPPALPPATTTTPTRTRTVLSNVVAVGATPFFRYSARGDATTGAPLATPLQLGPTLSAADLEAQTRLNVSIDVSFAASGRNAKISTPLQTTIFDRSPGCYFG
jgi:prepilin-type N-terminal cleavage/methylation domain-containing protein